MTNSEKDFNELQRVISALAYEYSTVISVDLAADTIDVYKLHDRVKETAPLLWNNRCYSSGKEYYVQNIIHKEDREYALTKSSIEYISNNIAWPGSKTLVYRNVLGQYGEEKIVRIDEGHAVIGFANKDAEIRKQKAYEEELIRAKAAAETANEAKSAFLFGMSHDVRTPLNAVLGLSALAKNNLDNPEKLKSYLDEISNAGEELLSIIERILEITRIESKKVEILSENTDTEDVYKSLVSIFHRQAEEKKVSVAYNNNLEHRWLYMDRQHMEEVIVHIVSNAIKYTPTGGNVQVVFNSLPGRNEHFTVSQIIVTDDGIGMSEEFQKRLFEKFEREENTTISGAHGSGLGLTIVKKLVDLMHGTIEIESKKGEGTCVTVEIPHEIGYVPIEDDENGPEFDESILDGKRILLAEDIEVNAMIAMEILSERGIKVDRARDGRECVNMLMNADEYYYDAILMDIQMPEMNGYLATQAIRNLHSRYKSTIPIIALTANSFMEDRIRAISAGMNGHIGKPIDIEQLFATIARALTFKDYYVDNSELNEFREKYFNLGCPCGYFVYRADGDERIIGANDVTASIFGCDSSDEFLEYVHSSFQGMVHPDDLDEIERAIETQQAASDSAIDMISYRIIRKDGQVRDVVDIGYKAFDGRDILYYVYIADVTDLNKERDQ